MERTLIVRHNWHDRTESKWLFWLEKKLTELGFTVSLAELPESATKNLHQAVKEVEDMHGIMGNNVHIVRHDPGCLSLLKYCEQIIARGTTEPTLLVAGIPKRDLGSFSVLKMIGGPKALKALPDGEHTFGNESREELYEDIESYEPDPMQLTLDTMEVKLMVVYGGQIMKSLPAKNR